jgi:hypothetical protein
MNRGNSQESFSESLEKDCYLGEAKINLYEFFNFNINKEEKEGYFNIIKYDAVNGQVNLSVSFSSNLCEDLSNKIKYYEQSQSNFLLDATNSPTLFSRQMNQSPGNVPIKKYEYPKENSNMLCNKFSNMSQEELWQMLNSNLVYI